MGGTTACWHCKTIDGYCRCFLCGRFTGPLEWSPGPCIACAGRKRADAERPQLEEAGIDPRDIKHWTYIRSITGGGHRVFDPFGEVRAAIAKEEARGITPPSMTYPDDWIPPEPQQEAGSTRKKRVPARTPQGPKKAPVGTEAAASRKTQ